MSALEKIQTTPEGPPSIATVIAQMTPEIQRALPAGLDADRIARIALTAVRKDKSGNLARCTPESFAGSLLTAAAMGLEPNLNGEAYLIPYGRECTLVIGYAGMAKLFWQHPLAKHLDAQAVHEHDEFDYEYGLEPRLIHKPAKKDRGQVIAYYAVATLTTGAQKFVVLSPDEVRALRKGKTGSSDSKIPDPQFWMEKKTVLRQLFKLLPKTAELHRAIDSDERSGAELHKTLVHERQATAALEAGGTVDTETGEIHDAEVVENTQWDGVDK